MSEDVYLTPMAPSARHTALDSGLPLGGGPLSFNTCEVARREHGAQVPAAREVLGILDLVRVDGAPDWLRRLSTPRPALDGLAFTEPRLMGVLNVTPDSFSDGGAYGDSAAAIDHGLALWQAGATILDVGGESTRPGAEPVPVETELHRVLPVVEGLAAQGCRVSIDTRNARTLREAVAAGARIVNDVTALAGDPDSLAAVAETGACAILMHMQGEPQTMQQAPHYADAALDVYDALAARLEACVAAGIPSSRLAVDPGIGFGKSVRHNMEILHRLGLYQGLGVPVVFGMSRKSSIAKVSRDEPAAARLPGSLAAALLAAQRGAQILRVHDVAETAQALAVWRAAEQLAHDPEPATETAE